MVDKMCRTGDGKRGCGTDMEFRGDKMGELVEEVERQRATEELAMSSAFRVSLA